MLMLRFIGNLDLCGQQVDKSRKKIHKSEKQVHQEASMNQWYASSKSWQIPQIFLCLIFSKLLFAIGAKLITFHGNLPYPSCELVQKIWVSWRGRCLLESAVLELIIEWLWMTMELLLSRRLNGQGKDLIKYSRESSRSLFVSEKYLGRASHVGGY